MSALQTWERDTRERRAHLERFQSAVVEVGRTDNPTPSQTVIIGALAEIIRSQCSATTCHIFMFSDMIDVDIRDRLAAREFSVDDASMLGRETGENRPLRTGPAQAQFGVVVWGMGRSEATGEGLPDAQNQKLIAFWQALLEEWGATDVEMGLDMPNEARLGDMSRRLCPAG